MHYYSLKDIRQDVDFSGLPCILDDYKSILFFLKACVLFVSLDWVHTPYYLHRPNTRSFFHRNVCVVIILSPHRPFRQFSISMLSLFPDIILQVDGKVTNHHFSSEEHITSPSHTQAYI